MFSVKISTLIILLFFVISSMSPVVSTASNGLDVLKADHLSKLIFNSQEVEAELLERIDQGSLLEPAGASAYDTYVNYVEDYPEDSALQRKLRRTLIAALAEVADKALAEYFDFGGNFILNYMSNSSQNMFGKIVPLDQYYYIAAELSGTDHFLYDALLSKGLFVEALKLSYIEDQDLEMIESKLKASLILTMDASYTYYELGLVYFEKGAYQLACDNLDLARRLNPKWVLPQEQLKLAQEALGLSKNN